VSPKTSAFLLHFLLHSLQKKTELQQLQTMQDTDSRQREKCPLVVHGGER